MSNTNEHGGERTMQLLGGSITFKVSDADYELAELTAGPGFAPTPHVHRTHHEVFYVIEGEFEFLVGDDTVRLGPGGVVDVPPGTVHDFCNPGPRPARLLGIVSPGGLNKYFEEIEEQVLAGTLDESVLAELRVKYDTENVPVVWRPEPLRASKG